MLSGLAHRITVSKLLVTTRSRVFARLCRTDTKTNRRRRRLGPVADIEFLKYVGQMVVHGLLADVEIPGDFLIGLSGYEVLQHFDFALGESGGKRASCLTGARLVATGDMQFLLLGFLFDQFRKRNHSELFSAGSGVAENGSCFLDRFGVTQFDQRARHVVSRPGDECRKSGLEVKLLVVSKARQGSFDIADDAEDKSSILILPVEVVTKFHDDFVALPGYLCLASNC